MGNPSCKNEWIESRGMAAACKYMDDELYAFRRIFPAGNACFFRKTFFNFFDAAEPHCRDRVLGKFRGCQHQGIPHIPYFWSVESVSADVRGCMLLLDMPKNKSSSIFNHWTVGLDRCGVNWLYCMHADCTLSQQQILSVLLYIGHDVCSSGQLFGEKLCWEYTPSKAFRGNALVGL